jgi:ZIP family zinc transporter
MPYEVLTKSIIAGLLASVACGIGVLPLLLRRFDPEKHTGLGYGLAGGLMFAASVYNLILPGLGASANEANLTAVLPVIFGILLGASFLWGTDSFLSVERLEKERWRKWGSKREILIFVAMAVHSIPEGVAVGVGYASGELFSTKLGTYIAVAIGIHNIPEGLAVGIPFRSAGASIMRCFWVAFLTSLPQPIAAVPAGLASWFFQPLMPIMMGFAAGAMIFLILLEIIPQALHSERPIRIAWAFTVGFCLMILVQVVL